MDLQIYSKTATRMISVLDNEYSWLEKYMANTLTSMLSFDENTPEYSYFFYEFCSAQQKYLYYVNMVNNCYEIKNNPNILYH